VAVLPSLDEAAASTVDVAHPRVTEAATTTLTPGVLLDHHLMLANLAPAAKFVSMVGMASTSTSYPNRYLDSGATDHITASELQKLTMHETYHDIDQIRAANAACMDIIHVGKAIMSTCQGTQAILSSVLESVYGSLGACVLRCLAPAIDSSGNKKYYTSLIDDYSKFT
jgi:hypothetical protein